jgi:hypothetical protein
MRIIATVLLLVIFFFCYAPIRHTTGFSPSSTAFAAAATATATAAPHLSPGRRKTPLMPPPSSSLASSSSRPVLRHRFPSLLLLCSARDDAVNAQLFRLEEKLLGEISSPFPRDSAVASIIDEITSVQRQHPAKVLAFYPLLQTRRELTFLCYQDARELVEGYRWRVLYPRHHNNVFCFWKVVKVSPEFFFRDMPGRVRRAVSAMEPLDKSMRVLAITEREAISDTPNQISLKNSWHMDHIVVPLFRAVIQIAHVLEAITWGIISPLSSKRWASSLIKRRFEACPISHTKEIVTTTNFPLVANPLLINYYHNPCNRGFCNGKCHVMRDNNVIYASRFVVIMENPWQGSTDSQTEETRHMVSFYK